jgi:TolB-like protein/DNA-binding winged helix-turn-helix (wHTH) protein
MLIRLSPQQFRLLRFLAENAERICTRDEIQQTIWGSETFVDFDRGLNVCMAQLRAALNDDSEAPRFIQTVPRRGYRFVAPVERVDEPRSPAPPSAPRRRMWIVPAAVVLCAAASLLAWRALRPASHTMLAVLPIENVTGRAEDLPAVEGLLSELISEFGSVLPDRLGVIGRTSVMRYAGQHPSVEQLRRDLAVDYLLEGEARREAARLRITVRLIRAADQGAAWSETYEQDAASSFEMQEDVAARVAAAVAGTLYPTALKPAANPHRSNPQSYEAFLNGRYWQSQDTRKALDWFQQASVRDPSFAPAWTAIAVNNVRLALSGRAPAHAAFDQVRQAAERALRLDEATPEAHGALAQALFWREWNWSEAQRHYQRALAINPSYAQGRHDYASWLIAMGRSEAGVSELRRSIALDPLSAHVNVNAGWVLLQAHHYDEAIAQARRALELEPTMAEAQACIARAQFYGGKSDAQAIEFYRRLAGSSDSYQKALAQAVLGHREESLDALEAAFRDRHILMPLIGTEPAFGSLHAEPRFRALLEKMRLPAP